MHPAGVDRAVETGISRRKIYDALILAAAAEADAHTIYTSHVRDFERIAPNRKGRMRAPRSAFRKLRADFP